MVSATNLEQRLLPRFDAIDDPDGAATLIANELADVRHPDLPNNEWWRGRFQRC